MNVNAIAKPLVKTTTTQRTDLPPLTAYDAVSLWVKTDEKSGEVDMSTLKSMSHPINKTGAGLNAAFDRILASFAKRGGKGYNDLDGYNFVALTITPAGK